MIACDNCSKECKYPDARLKKWWGIIWHFCSMKCTNEFFERENLRELRGE